jgi:organic radical activating enzyme
MEFYDFRNIPFDTIQSCGSRQMLYSKTFSIFYTLTRYCNYNCSYCWPFAHSAEKLFRPTETVIATIDEIKRQARERGFTSFNIAFSGGEPIYHPGLLDIVKHISEDTAKCDLQMLNMTTNLSRGTIWWLDFILATGNLHNVAISGSWHHEVHAHDLVAQRELFAEKMALLQANDIQQTVVIIMIPALWAILYEDALYFEGRGLNVTLRPQITVDGSRAVDGYDDGMRAVMQTSMAYQMRRVPSDRPIDSAPRVPQVEIVMQDARKIEPQVEMTDRAGTIWYLDIANRMTALDFTRFKGWRCSAGYQAAIVREPGGTVHRGLACADKPLGTIETGFRLFDAPKRCITEVCVSDFDSKLPKVRES